MMMTSQLVPDSPDRSELEQRDAVAQMAALLRVSAETMRYMAETYAAGERALALSAAVDIDHAAEKLERTTRPTAAQDERGCRLPGQGRADLTGSH